MNTQDINKLLKLITLFTDVYEDISLAEVQTILILLRRGDAGTQVADLQKELGCTLSSASRNMRMMLKVPKKGKTGMDLIDYVQSVDDARVHIATPNKRLLALASKLDEALSTFKK